MLQDHYYQFGYDCYYYCCHDYCYYYCCYDYCYDYCCYDYCYDYCCSYLPLVAIPETFPSASTAACLVVVTCWSGTS